MWCGSWAHAATSPTQDGPSRMTPWTIGRYAPQPHHLMLSQARLTCFLVPPTASSMQSMPAMSLVSTSFPVCALTMGRFADNWMSVAAFGAVIALYESIPLHEGASDEALPLWVYQTRSDAVFCITGSHVGNLDGAVPVRDSVRRHESGPAHHAHKPGHPHWPPPTQLPAQQ